MCGCSQMTTTTMELPSLVCLCVLISCGVSSADANEPVKVVVMEGNDVILPCSLSTEEDIEFKLFDWKKDGQKEVFMYDGGVYYENGLSGQDKQFKGRVSHFSDQLKNGNASIKIQNTKVADSGNYTCDFPRLQPRKTFHIELVVIADDILKRRNISGAAPEPSIEIIDETSDWSLLQCAVRGAFPEPKVEWKDSSGNIVPAEDPQVTKRGDRYDVILNATVTKTDRYHCVATQKEIHHQIDSKTFVRFGGAASKPSVTILKRDNEVLLQCEVLGVSPKTKVEWKDSSGNIVPAEEPKITDRGGSYDIILEAPLTKTDNFRCVVTQKEIDHQIYAESYVTHGASTGWIVAAVLSVLLVVVVVVAVVIIVLLRKRLPQKGSNDESTTRDGNSSSELLEKSQTRGLK